MTPGDRRSFGYDPVGNTEVNRTRLAPMNIMAADVFPYNAASKIPGWRSYTLMTLLFASALGAAFGHHEFYLYLHNRHIQDIAIDQGWVIRVGNGFAFLFKTCLVAAVSVAFCQGIWYCLRRKGVRIGGLDAIFGVLQNPLNIFNRDLFLKTSVLFVMALICWILPLSAIFAPGALTGSSHCIKFNMSVVSTQEISNKSVDVPNLTSLDSDVGFCQIGWSGTGHHYFVESSGQLRRLALRVLTNGEFIYLTSPCGNNCSYTMSFNGPAYQCTIVSPQSWQPFWLGEGLPDPSYGLYPYIALQLDWGSNETSQGFWIATGANGSVIHCRLYASTYTTLVQYINNVPSFTTDIIYHNEINSSAAVDSYDWIAEYVNGSAAMKYDVNAIERKWVQLNFYAINDAVTRLLAGYFYSQSELGGYEYDYTVIGYSNLVDVGLFHVSFDNLPQKLEDLLRNTTLSLLSFLQRPPTSSINGSEAVSPARYITSNVTLISYPARYSYSPKVLWEVYIVAIGCGGICIVAGCYMLFRNGVDANFSFSQILVTTRNDTLDQICETSCLGGENISEELRSTELLFGYKTVGTEIFYDERHVCFGLRNEIELFKKR